MSVLIKYRNKKTHFKNNQYNLSSKPNTQEQDANANFVSGTVNRNTLQGFLK